jgi:hypothetical protein
MAEATWETLTSFGIEKRVRHDLLKHRVILSITLQIMAFMTDNASNNNTLVDGIVERANKQGVSMRGDWIRLRCMPHTVHLAALKVCIQCNFSLI